MSVRTLIAGFMLFLSAIGGEWAVAGPPSREESERQARIVEELRKLFAAETTPAGKLRIVARQLQDEPNVDLRHKILEVAAQLTGPELDSFFSGVLAGDADAGVRSKAAEVLGRQGSENCLRALGEAAGTDKTTDILRGCILGKSSARRTAMFAIADLAGRFPKLADKAAAELTELRAVEDPTDTESLADARKQSLYRVTRNEALLKPFYDRLQSKDAKVRRDGVVAFRFCGLKIAPAEVTAAMTDEDQEVRSWAALVLGEIGDVKTAPALLAIAEDTKQDIGPRCNAIHSIGRMKSAGSTMGIRKLLEDPSEVVQAQAAIALYRITGEKVKQFPAGYNAD